VTDYTLQVKSVLEAGDRLIIEYLPDAPPPPPPPPPPTGELIYDQPAPEEITPDLLPLPGLLHDPGLYHGLAVGVTADGERRVYHADHEHGQNPGQAWLAEVFGDYIQHLSQSISYLWQTPNENQLKHEGYKWGGFDYRADPKSPRVANAGFVLAAFVQTHAMGTAAAALARFHSFWGMALVRSLDGREGIILTGGHQDFGQLVVPYKGGPQAIVALPDAPQPPYDDEAPPYRGHSTLSAADDGNTTWNSVYRRASLPSIAPHVLVRYAFRQTRIHQYPAGDPADAAAYLYYSGGGTYDPDTVYNSTKRNLPYQVEIDIPESLAGPDGMVRFEGFTDVRGNVIEAAEPGPNAVPLVIDAPAGSYMINYPGEGSPFDLVNFFDGDVYFDGAGQVVDRFAPGARPSGWVGPKN
jgi:hypothetical protein